MKHDKHGLIKRNEGKSVVEYYYTDDPLMYWRYVVSQKGMPEEITANLYDSVFTYEYNLSSKSWYNNAVFGWIPDVR